MKSKQMQWALFTAVLLALTATAGAADKDSKESVVDPAKVEAKAVDSKVVEKKADDAKAKKMPVESKVEVEKAVKAEKEKKVKEVMAEPVAYKIDTVHSTIGFAIKHLQIATTRGHFNEYTGEVIYSPDNPKAFKADVTIQVDSIDTNNEKRDEHLRSKDFFNADKFPTITFEVDRLVSTPEGQVIIGDLTIRDVSKTLQFPVDIAGPVKSPTGGNVLALSGETQIDRKDFGITWNKVLDSGGLVVGENVKVIVELELHEK